MLRQSPNTNLRLRHLHGVSTIELLAVATVLAIITAFGFLGVSKARASVRLSGAAREYASYIEKARIFSIRRHADDAAQRATVAINANKTSYDVILDIDGNGTMDTRTINLPSGVSFDPRDNLDSVSFDWRGRTLRTAGGVTEQNAQVSVRLKNSDDTVSVDVTGSGDITIDSRVFDDSVPNVSLNVGNLAAGATPVPTPESGPVNGASPSPSQSPLANVVPSPTPVLDGLLGSLLPGSSPSPTSSPSPSASPSPIPSPSPVATATPSPSPTPSLTCSITTDPTTIVMSTESSTTIKVSHTSNSTISISGDASKSSDLQVSPNKSQMVGAGSYTTFTIKSKKSMGVYSVTFSTSCGSKTVPVVIGL